ncbi:GNAT family N-acetyltransferase [Georgenia sp. TF02-10]|uniref:GNAT family N-acetyltransferase n=1 Tax=Georgenia sp. TF02-10 TaxID=2917725 RepID=UPI001FA6D2E4|nr:GNAT family protein [Georgenia sp. TF02-10]UNX53709.1 GNAT family N-acetyltransferase [Georgenia sp. TF02-10]
MAVPSQEPPFVPVADARPADRPWPAMSWPPPPDARLAGRVVELVPLEPEALGPAVFRALDEEAVWQHMTGRPADAAAFVQAQKRQVDAGVFPWVVRLRRPYRGQAAGAVVGMTSYRDVSVRDARLEIGSTAYAPAVWGSLVNPDAKHLLLGYAFEVLGAGRVQLKTDVRNTRSQQAIARLGARYEGTLRRYQRRADGTVRDTVLFSVVAEEWPAVRDRLEARMAGG